ncbi:MAG: hypothetical protein WCQ50_11830 [Spirochaetota bacterium]
MKLFRSLLLCLACALLFQLAGCARAPEIQSGNTSTSVPEDADKKSSGNSSPENGSPKDVANKLDLPKKAAQAAGDFVKGGATALGGTSDTVAPIAGAAANTFKAVIAGANIVDSYNKGGVPAAVETTAIEGCKHVASGYVTSIVTTAVTTTAVAYGAPVVAVGAVAAVAGLGTRYIVGKAVEAAGPYVNKAVTGAGNAVGNALIETVTTKDPTYQGVANDTPNLPDYAGQAKAAQAAQDARDAKAADDADRAAYQSNRAFNDRLNQAAKNMARPLTKPPIIPQAPIPQIPRSPCAGHIN